MNERFSKLKFPIHKHMDDPDIAQTFPELFKYKEFQDWGFKMTRVKVQKEDEAEKQKYKDAWLPDPERMKYRKNVIAYMIYLLDPLSEFQSEFERLDERKEAAAFEAGFKRNSDDEWPEFVQGMMEYTDDQFSDLCLRFLKIFKSDEWFEICTLQVEIDRNNRMRWKGMKGTSADKLSPAENRELQKLGDFNREKLTQLRILKDNFVYGDAVMIDRVEEEMITPENANRLIG